MTVVNGFVIILMIALLAYSVYRLYRKRKMLMLAPVCAQVFVLAIAVLGFMNDAKTTAAVEASYILVGIVPPAVFIIADYRAMVKRVKLHGAYKGLVEKSVPKVRDTAVLSVNGINPPRDEKQVPDILKDFEKLPEDLRKNLRKCLNRANALIAEGRHSEAYWMYDAVSRFAGCSWMLYYNLASVCCKLKRYEDAADAYKKALETCGDEAAGQRDIHYNMGCVCYMAGRYEKAARCFEKAVAADPGDEMAAENLAYACARAGNAQKGIDMLRHFAADSGHLRMHFILAELLAGAERFDEAAQEFRKCLELRPDSDEAICGLGKMLVRMGKYGDAIEMYDKAIRIGPDNFQAWSGKAFAYSRMSKWKEAVDAYGKAVKIKPDDYLCHYNMGIALDEMGKRKDAIEAYGNAIKLCPDFTDAYNNLGIALCLSGRYKEALEVYEEGIARNPGDYGLYFNMGMCYYEIGRYGDAVAAYKNAIERNPGVLEIFYYLGSALTEMRRYNDAVEAYKSALAAKPDDGELYYNIAAIYAMLGRYDISLENLKKAIELNGNIRKSLLGNRAFDGLRGRKEFKQLF